jgi:hypothetical protein
MNEKDLQGACESFQYTKMNEKDLQSALQVFSVYKNERKRLATRVASLFSMQK